MADATSQSETMLVRSENLDQLLMLAGQVIVASSTQEMAYRSLQSLYAKGSPIDRETLDHSKDLAETTSHISGELHHLVQAIRTVTLRDFTFRARRLVRDIARKTGKRVRFEIEGEDTTIDKSIVERLYDPISHQLRNAIDHGIEDALTRSREGKDEEGLVTFRAYNTERETFIEIEDDGAGVDLEALRKKGIKQGLITEDTAFDESVALQLMCRPGVSTVESVSQVSGRGVGMDVVYSNITDLGGTVDFTTTRGKGSRFTFRVPLVSAVNIMDALVVRADNYFYAFPISSVVTTLAVEKEHVASTFEAGRSIKYLNQLLPLHSLNYVLDRVQPAGEGEMLSIIVVEHKGAQVAFVVSEFLSPQKLVIIPFDGTLDVPGLAGTTVLAGRKLGFIVDVPTLLDLATQRSSAAGQAGLARDRKREAGDAAEGAKEAEAAAEPEPETRVEGGAAVSAAVPGEESAEQEQAGTAGDRQEFMAELEKLLPLLSEAAFAIESDPANTEHVNNTFRLFHTIKGNFIMMGLTSRGETVHSVESILDRVRGKELELAPEVMDIIMDGVSYVEEAVRMMRAGQWTDEPSPAILEQSAALMPEPDEDKEVTPTSAATEIELSHEATYRASIHRRNRTPFYQLYVEFDSGMQPSFLVACLIYKRVCELGDVLGTAPPLPDVEKGLMEGKFKLLFATPVDPDELDKTLNSLLTKHYGTTAVSLARFE